MSRLVFNVPVRIDTIRDALIRYPNSEIVVRMPNSKNLSDSVLDNLIKLKYSNRLKIQIVGGYDDDKIKNYPTCTFYTEDNIYTLSEAKGILAVLKGFEKGLNPKWDDLQKLVYFIGCLKDHMMYHPFHKSQPSKNIRSLTTLINGFPVCAGYALALKELCDRNGIECQLVVGSTNLEDAKRGRTTHAWNIVRINGNYIPVELTWNTGKYRRGSSLSILDLANVNEFIKKHFPTKYEKIQDYEGTLKSIDGIKLRRIESMINRDKKIEKMTFQIDRKDGSRCKIIQLGQFIRDDKYVYKYMYQDILPNGRLGKPIILYSCTNVADLVFQKGKKDEFKKTLKEKLNDRSISYSKREQLEKQLAKVEALDAINDVVDNVLFSRKNIVEAMRRGDYFIGEVYGRGESFATGAKVDLQFAKKIGYRQRTFTRRDGTSFVLEDLGQKSYGTFMNRIFEGVSDRSSYCVLQNSIYTDRDLFQDSRSAIPSELLSRNRLDKCCRENNGYVGHVNSGGVIQYDQTKLSVFKNKLFDPYAVKQSDFVDYYKDISFDEMKRLAKTYECVIEDGRRIVRNRVTKRVLTDPDLLLRVDFSLIWLSAAASKITINSDVPGFSYAFSDSSEEVFDKIYSSINKSMLMNGNIDPIAILEDIEKIHYKYADEIVIKLFASQYNVDVINKLFRKMNPSTIAEKHDIVSFGYGFSGEQNAYSLVQRRRKKELDRIMLDVIQESNGNISINKTENRNLK